MARESESIAVKKVTRSSSSLSAERKGRRTVTSKPPRSIGLRTKKAHRSSVPWEETLYPYLQNITSAAGLLAECLDDDEPKTFLVALRDVVLANGGVAKAAKASGLNRESLYKALSLNGNPSLQTVRAILSAVGIRITFEKAPKQA
jgi:probable addiction module antidote protein